MDSISESARALNLKCKNRETERDVADPNLIPRQVEVKLGNAVLGYRVQKSRPTKSWRGYNRAMHQLRDMEELIRHRHGSIVPDTDDADCYGDVAAILHLIADRENIEKSFPAWCRRWMPWASSEMIERMLYDDLKQRHQTPSDDALAQMLRLSYAERQALGIRTFGSHDVTKKDRAKLQAQRRREQDRARKARRRREQGCASRAQYEANSASRQKPWKQLGMARSTYYRHKRARR